MPIEESVAAAIKEWKHWGQNVLDLRPGAKNEKFDRSTTDRDPARAIYILETYCPAANSTTTAEDISKDDYAWSGVTICYFFRRGGYGRWEETSGAGFPFSAAHRKWIKLAIRADGGNASPKFMFKAFPIEADQAAPKLGDLVVYARADEMSKKERAEGKKAKDPTFEEAKAWFKRVKDDDKYASHSDLVVHVSPDGKFIEVIGGNVEQSVTKKIIPLDDKGRIADRSKPWFAVLRRVGS